MRRPPGGTNQSMTSRLPSVVPGVSTSTMRRPLGSTSSSPGFPTRISFGFVAATGGGTLRGRYLPFFFFFSFLTSWTTCFWEFVTPATPDGVKLT